MLRVLQNPALRQALGIPADAALKPEFLAQGEYNQNYRFVHPVTGETLVLRLNCGSQMHLENQIGYEFAALRLLEPSGRTPRPRFVDEAAGAMVQSFIPGRHLDYGADLPKAAACLAEIHAATVGQQGSLLWPEAPLRAILRECRDMFRVYQASPLADGEKRRVIEALLDRGDRAADAYEGGAYPLCCVNTELNNTNFLVEGDTARLVDWEKPIYGDPAQDLGHFLAPTTTFWKTDVIFTEAETRAFLSRYLQAVDGRFSTEGLAERVRVFIPITCLRGLTWCAMAWVQYQGEGGLRNASTRQKLDAYLDWTFLERIQAQFS